MGFAYHIVRAVQSLVMVNARFHVFFVRGGEKENILTHKIINMDTEVIVSLILGITNIASAILWGLIPGIRKQKIERLEEKMTILAKDIDSFYRIESLLLEKLSKFNGRKINTMKKEIRKQVMEEKGYPLSEYALPSRHRKEFNK